MLAEFGKFIAAAATTLVILYSIAQLARFVALRLGLSEKVVTNVMVIFVFLVSSYLWLFTGFSKRLEHWTGMPLATARRAILLL